MNYKRTALDFWRMTKTEKARKIVLLSLAAQAISWAAGLLLLGEDPVSHTAVSAGIWIGLLLISLFAAAVLAVPGWLIRGDYDVRPLFIAVLTFNFVAVFCSEVFTPLAHGTMIGMLFKLLIFACLVSAHFVLTLAWFMTLLPHRWAAGIFKGAIVFTAIASLGYFKSNVISSPTRYMKEVFEKRDSNLVSLVGGRAVSSAQISYELQLFDNEIRTGKKR